MKLTIISWPKLSFSKVMRLKIASTATLTTKLCGLSTAADQLGTWVLTSLLSMQANAANLTLQRWTGRMVLRQDPTRPKSSSHGGERADIRTTSRLTTPSCFCHKMKESIWWGPMGQCPTPIYTMTPKRCMWRLRCQPIRLFSLRFILKAKYTLLQAMIAFRRCNWARVKCTISRVTGGLMCLNKEILLFWINHLRLEKWQSKRKCLGFQNRSNTNFSRRDRKQVAASLLTMKSSFLEGIIESRALWTPLSDLI